MKFSATSPDTAVFASWEYHISYIPVELSFVHTAVSKETM